jgi:beta-glucosidase-like glycosyl hydrolase
MAEKKELKLEELTVRQKLGMTMIAHVDKGGANLDYILGLVRERALGAFWVPISYPDADEIIARIKDEADYPILAFADASTGAGEYKIGKANALGIAGSEELAYTFGKVMGSIVRSRGYNVICSPVLDMISHNSPCSMSDRSLGNDKVEVARLAVAMVRGMHDGGILAVAKHYPGTASGDYTMDSHMAETWSEATREELLEYNLYPYLELMKNDLLDGIMTKHTRFVKIDDEHPASFSERVIGIIRDEGFDGFAMTDALCMMGILGKYGRSNTLGLAIKGGNDLSLPYFPDNDYSYETLVDFYERGNLPRERLDEAVRRVLAAQHKAAMLSAGTVTDEDKKKFREINERSVYSVSDDGVGTSISRDGRHFFVVLTPQDYGDELSVPAVDTITASWYKPHKIAERLRELFPNSRVDGLVELPTRADATRVLEDNLEYEDVVFISYFNGGPYIGREHLTPRVLTIMDAMQRTDRISTLVHLGNPYVAEDFPHIPRRLFGGCSLESSLVALDVLAGIKPALGKQTYTNLNLK